MAGDSTTAARTGSDDSGTTTIAGRFEVLGTLGAGTTGEVLRARDELLGRVVALKLLRRAAEAPAELLREARALATLSHPSIAAVHELVTLDDDRVALVLELVEGPSLADHLAPGPMTVAEGLRLASAIAGALAHAHSRGVTHGDLKPANVVLTADGAPKLVDFGLGRLTTEPDTPAGGTPAYLPPERTDGDGAAARGDLYSFGALLFHLFAGHPPIAGASAVTLGALNTDVPQPVDQLIQSLLTHDPWRRPAAEEVAARLEALHAQRQLPVDGSVATPAFRGLLSFQERDAGAFFGRDEEIAQLAAMVSQPGYSFGVLYGESGCGKTSLAQAGLVPHLRAAGWIVAVGRPGPVTSVTDRVRREAGIPPRPAETPAQTLERAAREARAPLLVVLDQLEEAFTVLTLGDREALFDLVADATKIVTPRVGWLLTIRADFLHLVADAFDPRLPEPLAATRRYFLRSFSRRRAEEVLALSGRQGGLAADDELWTHVATDLVERERVLPSELQIVGQQIQQRRLLTVEEYRAAGGKQALVETFLDEVLAACRDPEAARRTLATLVTPEGTRRAASAAEITAASELSESRVGKVVDLLARARLLRVLREEDETRYELVHEYLIGRIATWTDQEAGPRERAARFLRRRLAERAVDPGATIPLRRLPGILRHCDWREDQRSRDLVRHSFVRGLGRLAAVVALVALGAAILATPFAVREAWTEEILADGHRAAARQAVFSPDGELLVTVGEDGKGLVWDFEARVVRAVLEAHTDIVDSVDFSPDGRWIATGGRDGRVVVWDPEHLDRPIETERRPWPIVSVRFTPDSELLVTIPGSSSHQGRASILSAGSWRRVAELPMNVSYGTIVFPEPRSLLSGVPLLSFRLPGGERLPSPFTGPRGAVNWIDLSPDRSRVVSIDSRGFVGMVRLEDDRELMRVRSHHDHGRAIAYSPDGRWIASGAEDILLWNASTQAPVQRLTHHAIVWNLVFTPDGRRLVSTHGDGAVLVWNLDERRLEANLGGHSGPVRAVAFSPDGTRLASAGDDRTVALWDLSQSRKTKVLAGQPTRVNALAFSPDGQWLVSCDQEGRAVLWDVPRAVRLSAVAEATGSGRPCYGVAVSPDGHRWAAGERLWSAEGTLLDELPGMSAYPVRFSPDGRWLVRAGDQGEVEVRSAGGAVAGFLPGAGPPGIEGLAVAPDSATFAVGTGTGEVRLYRLDPLSLLAVLGRHEARVRSIAISPDGRRLASAGDDGVIALWDPRRRRRAGVIARASSPVLAVAFSPDGRRLAAGLHDGSVRLYTVERSVWGVELGASEERP